MFLIGCESVQGRQSSNVTNPIVGAWRGEPSQLSTGDSTWALHYTTGGQVIVFSATGPDRGYYCKMGASKERKNPFATGSLTPEDQFKAIRYLFATFYANCGTYTINGRMVTRTREFGKHQFLVGVSITDEFKIKGDTMVTVSKEPWWEDTTKTLTTTIVWTRMK